LQSALAEIGSLQAQLRGVHLQAHLDQARILSAEQSAMYARCAATTIPPPTDITDTESLR
jgi:hypothetical protein